MTKMVTAPKNQITENAAKEGDSPLERRCENADCNVHKLVTMVPKRKTAQFVTEPCIIDKPMLVNGFTTIFQVDGTAAKISDLKKRVNGEPRTIYRIIPNTHAHIVNYVVVDTEGESLRKINSGEPATMKKLLDSQRLSAEQMLGKLMIGQGAYLQVANSAVGNDSLTLTPIPAIMNRKTSTPKPKSAETTKKPTVKAILPATTATNLSVSNTPTTVVANLQTSTPNVTPISNALGVLSRMPVTTTAKLPLRSVTIKKLGSSANLTLPMAAAAAARAVAATTSSTTVTTPNLPNHIRFNSSIKVRPFQVNKAMSSTPINTAVTTATTKTSTTTVAKKRNSTPLIKTVPLSQLQEQPKQVSVLKPVEVAAPPTAPPTADLPSSISTSTDIAIFEKMQKELEDLRRTVALLAETQKKTLTAVLSTEEDEEPQSKKAKI